MMAHVSGLVARSSLSVWLLLFLSGVVAFAFLPQIERLQQHRAAYQTAAEDKAWTQAQVAAVGPATPREPAFSTPTASALEALTFAAHLREQFTGLRELAEDKLAISFSAAEFARVSEFLAQLHESHGPVILEVSISARSPGLVDAVIVVAGSTL